MPKQCRKRGFEVLALRIWHVTMHNLAQLQFQMALPIANRVAATVYDAVRDLREVPSQETPLFDALLNGIGALLVFGHKRSGWTSIVDVDDLRILHHYVYDAGWRCALLGG